MSVRKQLEEMLTEAWSDIPQLAKFRVVATERNLDEIQVPTALLRMNTVNALPESPKSHRRVGILLTLISPHMDLDLAGDQLDEAVEAALDYFDTAIQHEGATIVAYLDHLAANIPLTLIASKD